MVQGCLRNCQILRVLLRKSESAIILSIWVLCQEANSFSTESKSSMMLWSFVDKSSRGPQVEYWFLEDEEAGRQVFWMR